MFFCLLYLFCQATDLDLIVKVLLVIRVKQVCNAVVGDLDGVITLQEHISGSQVPVNHPVLLQVIHTLKWQKCV